MKYLLFVLKEQKKQQQENINSKSMNHSYLQIDQKLIKSDNKKISTISKMYTDK